MANKFLSKKIIIFAAIFFGGLLIAAGVFTLTNFSAVKLSAASESPKWTQNAGAGISAPACAASTASITCVKGLPFVTLSFSDISAGSCNNSPFVQSSCDINIMLESNWQPNPPLVCDDLGFGIICIDPTGGLIRPSVWGISADFTKNSAIVVTTPLTPTNPLLNNTAYHYWIVGKNENYYSNIHGNDGTFTTPDCSSIPPTVKISASPATINKGQSSTLTWSSTNATSCSIDNGVGVVPHKGSTSVSPIVTTTYTLTCTGPGGSASSSASVTVNQPLPGDFKLNVGTGLSCNSVPLSWAASSDATAYRILKGNPRVDISPYQPYTALNFTDTSVSQNTTYQYQIEAYNAVGTNRSNALGVTTPYCPPTLSFSGSPTAIFEGQSTTLNWSSTFATSCAASGAWSGSKAVSGSEVVIPSPPPSVTYTLTCAGPGGSTGPQSVTVNITPLALPEFKEIIPR